MPIYRVGESKGLVFFVMAYVNGETLGERLRTRGPLPTAVATRLLREVTWALSYAHGRGIVHRDVKPDNVFLVGEPGAPYAVKIVDFGFAKLLAGETFLPVIFLTAKIQPSTHRPGRFAR